MVLGTCTLINSGGVMKSLKIPKWWSASVNRGRTEEAIFKTCFFKLKTKHRIFLFFQSLILRWFWKQKITSIIDEMKVK
jgi:hypothetical protein